MVRERREWENMQQLTGPEPTMSRSIANLLAAEASRYTTHRFGSVILEKQWNFSIMVTV